jgi:hypothetical protein
LRCDKKRKQASRFNVEKLRRELARNGEQSAAFSHRLTGRAKEYDHRKRPSGAAMCGFSRRISQSGNSPYRLFQRLQMASLYLPLVIAKKCTAQIAQIEISLTLNF